MIYDTGDVSRLEITFTAEPEEGGNPVPADPEVVKLLVQKPDTSVPVTYVYNTDNEIVRISAGLYRSDFTLDVPGEWLYRWEGTGGATAVEEGSFGVRPSTLGEVTIPALVQYHLQRTETTLPAASFAIGQNDARERLFDEYQTVKDAYEGDALSAADSKLLREAIAYETAADLAEGKISLVATLSASSAVSTLKVGPIELRNGSGSGSAIPAAWRGLGPIYHAEARRKMNRISFVASTIRAGSGRSWLQTRSPSGHDCPPYLHERRRPC